MVDCNQENIKNTFCTCTYSCSRRGKCCECVKYHLAMDELPGCFFAKISEKAERTYNRNFKYFARLIFEK